MAGQWVVVAALLLVMTSTGAVALPARLRTFLERRVSAALAGSTRGRIDDQPVHPAAPALLDILTAAAQGEDRSSKWVHRTVEQAAVAMENDPTLSAACVCGEISLLELATAQVQRREAALNMYNVINGHHREMRKVVQQAADGDDGNGAAAAALAASDASAASEASAAPPGRSEAEAAPVDNEAWQHATSDAGALRDYAAAATQIGSRAWVRAGIDWSVEQANSFLRDGGGARLTKREAVGLAYATSGAPPDEAAVEWLMRTASERGGRSAGEPIRLLDVGSCGTLFDDRYDGVECTALDLCPQANHPTVYQCDFLELGVCGEGAAPTVEAHADFPAGTLRALPAASYDVVAFSLVLSYLPMPRQRGELLLAG